MKNLEFPIKCFFSILKENPNLFSFARKLPFFVSPQLLPAFHVTSTNCVHVCAEWQRKRELEISKKIFWTIITLLYKFCTKDDKRRRLVTIKFKPLFCRERSHTKDSKYYGNFRFPLSCCPTLYITGLFWQTYKPKIKWKRDESKVVPPSQFSNNKKI